MQQHILWGAVLSVIGIASALVLDPTLGGAVLVLGAGLQAWGLHSLGRSGPEQSALEHSPLQGNPLQGSPAESANQK